MAKKVMAAKKMMEKKEMKMKKKHDCPGCSCK